MDTITEYWADVPTWLVVLLTVLLAGFVLHKLLDLLRRKHGKSKGSATAAAAKTTATRGHHGGKGVSSHAKTFLVYVMAGGLLLYFGLDVLKKIDPYSGGTTARSSNYGSTCNVAKRKIFAPAASDGDDTWSDWVYSQAGCAINTSAVSSLYRYQCLTLANELKPGSDPSCYEYSALRFQKMRADETDTSPLPMEVWLAPIR